MDGDVETTSIKETENNRFQLKVEDHRIQKDSTQEFSLREKLKADKIDTTLVNVKKFLGSYSLVNPQELIVNLINGNVGNGTIKGLDIELHLPPREEAIAQMRIFVDQVLPDLSEDERNNISSELVMSLSASTILHEGVHGLLDSKPGSKFTQDLERVSGFANKGGDVSILLDEGIAYAIQGIYAPGVEHLGSLSPTPRESDRSEVKTRKELGMKLRPKIEEYIKANRQLDDRFLSFASEQLK